jgi:DNA-binding XRE family transcriptional regulator
MRYFFRRDLLMGSPRKRPARLGEKLLAVREKLGYTMVDMADMLSDDEVYVYKQDVHKFEKNERDPSLIILLRYSRLGKVPMEVFADDRLDLP